VRLKLNKNLLDQKLKDEVIAEHQKYVMNTYFRIPLVLVKGQGSFVWDNYGDRYLDFWPGWAVNSLGHCHPRVVAAVKKQVDILIHVSNYLYHPLQGELAQLLVEASFPGKVFFCNSGAEAVEGAIKLARKYARTILKKDGYEIITAFNSFHGRTLGALTATGQFKYQQDFHPLVPGFKYVPFNDLKTLEEAVGEKTCAVLLEPIQGEGGVNVASPEYFRGVRELCSRHNVLLILDEVQTGLGRTGKMFAYQHYGIGADVITLAKGLGGGVPIGAVIARSGVAEALIPGNHASTFGGNPLACAAGIAVLETIKQQDVLKNVNQQSEYFFSRLEGLRSRFPFLREIRGEGLLLGVELDFPGKEIVEQCRQRKLLINCTAEKVLRMAPSLLVTSQEIDMAVEVLEAVFSRQNY